MMVVSTIPSRSGADIFGQQLKALVDYGSDRAVMDGNIVGLVIATDKYQLVTIADKTMANGNKKQQGMTLLEVMVALVIFSPAALALMNSVSLNVRFTHGLADTLQASWVAENQLAEAQLTRTDFPDAEQQGTEIMGGRSWNWRKQRVKTADNVWANTLRVYAESDESQPVISLRIIPPGESK